MVLRSIFSSNLITVSMESEDKEESFEELVQLYSNQNPKVSRSLILDALRSREAKLSTGVKPGIAVPHARIPSFPGVTGIIGISRNGIDYDSLDGNPVHLIFLILASDAECALQLRSLKRLSFLLDDPEFYPSLLQARDAVSVYNELSRFEDILTTSM
ncbi:PTS sugar transporter subunit IIA [Teretinema zuelzerae]|nr:PTS sugar transporter subunit IIA [Teretinema zuelzerae]